MFKFWIEFVCAWFVVGLIFCGGIGALFAFADWRFERKMSRDESIDRGGHVKIER